jgi:hypothetical protein
MNLNFIMFTWFNILATNGLRVGDVACVAPAAGYIAYTMLWDGLSF